MNDSPSFSVILVEPQLGENIGMVARAMWNCGIRDLRLVNPRDGWPSQPARAACSGSGIVVEAARVYESTSDAIADLNFVLATTARSRDMTKPVFTPEAAAKEMRGRAQAGSKIGVLYGKESSGLDNDDVALADATITVPLNPEFTSLNLAQAVLLLSYEWFKLQDSSVPYELQMPDDTRPANKQELLWLYEHLEQELDNKGFLMVTEKRPIMVRKIRNMLARAQMTEQEIRIYRGMISALVRTRRPGEPAKDSAEE